MLLPVAGPRTDEWQQILCVDLNQPPTLGFEN
jgi:hypothetical protein